MIFSYIIKSPVGLLEIIADEKFLLSLKLVYEFKKGIKNKIIENTIIQLKEYFIGTRREFNLPLYYQGSDFQKLDWDKVQEVSFGEKITYQDLAKKINKSNAQRAVGGSLNKNPILIIIPCHRVISKKDIGGYVASVSIKQKLLDLENTDL